MKHDPAWTLPVPIAGKKYFNLGINRAYEAARLGEIPTVRIGRKVLACVPAIEKMISQGASPPAAPKPKRGAKIKNRSGGGRRHICRTPAECAAVPVNQPIQVELGNARITLTSSERLMARSRGGEFEFARLKAKTLAKYTCGTGDAIDAEGNNSP